MTTRATAKNRHGLHRRIPAAVEREVRQRCKFGCVICRAGFYDDAGNPTLRLLENRWVGPTAAWDIKVERARIQVQTAPGRPVLCLRLAPPGTLVAEQLDMRFKNAHVPANEHAYAVGRYLPDGQNFWFTAHVVIPASHANGAAIEFMTPAQAARQLQTAPAAPRH